MPDPTPDPAPQPAAEPIFHTALADDWAQAQRSGEYTTSTRGHSLAEEGYIHASTRAQLDGVLATYYADLDPAGLRLLVLDVAALEAAGSPVRWDPVPGAAAPFPHVYGPIPTAAVSAVLPVTSQ